MQYTTLREANIARQREWETTPLSLSFRSNELGGELGEVAELLLDANHWNDDHMRVAFLMSLSDEISDGIICVDLVGITAGASPARAVHGFNTVLDDVQWCARMLRDAGALQNILKKYERVLLGIKGGVVPHISDVERRLKVVNQSLYDLAWTYGIKPDAAVAAKFNKTSEKVGLATRLHL
jgi:hypothetical protein